MFNKRIFFALAIFLMVSTKINSIGFSANPELIKQFKQAYAKLAYWIA